MIKKGLFIIFCSVICINAQIKDTVEHYNLSLHFNKYNHLYKVINNQNNKEFNGWGWYEYNTSSKVFNYYVHNKLIYRDIRDLNNKIICREYPFKNNLSKWEIHEFYENNTSLIEKKYFIILISDDEDLIKKKNGKYYEYYRNGKIKTTGQYKDDKKNGKWSSFDENGKML